MTATDSSPTPPDPVSDPAATASKKSKIKKPGRWRRRIIWTLSVLVVVAFAGRALLPLALPVVLQKVAGAFGLTFSYDRLELNMFSGDAAIWGIKVLPKEGGAAILETEYCHGNLSVTDLFKGKLSVWRAEADGVDVNLDRNPDGHIPLLDRFVTATSTKTASPAPSAPTSSGKPQAIDLSSPLRLDALRLGHIRVHIHDRGVTPEVDTELAMDVRLSDLGSTTSPAKFEMNLSADPILDSMKINGEGTSGGKNLNAKFNVICRGLRLKSAAAYLQPLGIVPIGDSITLHAAGNVHTSAAPNNADGFTGAVAFDHLSADVDGIEAMALDNLSLTADTIDSKSVHLSKLLIDGVRATAGRAPDGNIRVLGVEYVGVTKPAAVVIDGTNRPVDSNHAYDNVDSIMLPQAAASPIKEDGQNVLYGDGHADFPHPNPFDNTSQDTIYTARSVEPKSTTQLILFATSLPPASQTPAPAKSQGPPAIVASLLAEPWSLGEIALRNARIDLHDQGVSPEVNVSLIADEFAAKNIDHDPQNLNTIVALTGKARVPGLISDVKITGTALPFSDQKHLHVDFAANGIRPDAIRPYLDLLGLESQLKSGTFTTSLDASGALGKNGDLSADLTVGKVSFKDDAELLSLNGVTIKGISLAPDTGRIGVGSIEISGPALSAAREQSGDYAAFGFRTKPRQAAMTEAAAEKVTVVAVQTAANAMPHPVAAQSTTIASLPQITVGSFSWKDIRVNLQDQSVNPPAKLSLSDVGVEMKNLTTELNTDGRATPGHIHAWLAAPEIAKQLEFNADLTPRATGLDFDANVTGNGMTLAGLTPYLKAVGIAPTLKDGSLALHAKASVDKTPDDKLTASLVADHITYRDGTTELAGLDEIAIKNIGLVKNELNVDLVQVTRPRGIARRNADGSLEAGGVRLLKQSETAPENAPVIAAANNVTIHVAATAAVPHSPSQAPTTKPSPETPATPFVVVVKKLTVEDSAATWSDLAVQPPVNVTSGATVHLDNFVFGRPAEPAILSVVAHADGVADHCTVDGKISADYDAQSIHLDIAATGVRAGPLSAYLPPGLESSLKDGRFSTTVDAGLSKNPVGGLAANLVIGSTDFRDGPADPPLFKLDSVRVEVPRIDLPDTALAVKEISATGVETHAEKTIDGKIQLLGLALGGKARRDTGFQPVPAVPTTQVATSQPIETSTHGPEARVAMVPTTAPVVSVADLLAAAHKTLPLITVDKLDLNLSKLTLADLSRPESKPLIISDLHLINVNRIEWLGKDAGAKPPTHLQLTCRVDPLIDHVQVDTLVAPFAKQPTLQVDVAATGVKGDGLTGLVPELRPKLDGSNLTNGSFTAHLESSANFDRRSPIDFNISHGIDVDFDLTKVYYRGAPDGPVLVGVDEVQSEKIRIQPAESIVHVKTLEITKPIGLISQDEAGIHALGWVLKLPKPQSSGPTTQPAVASVIKPPMPSAGTAAGAPTSSADATAPPPVKPTGEIRIDKLLISGLDAQFNDYAVTPPMMIPLNGLEVEVKNLSTLDQFEDRPIRFSAVVNAGKVKLKKRPAGGGGIGGLFGNIIAGKTADKTPAMEDRDLFAQMTANGEISLYPKPHGWTKTSVSGLDLAALEGAANQAGVKLTNGLYDSEVDVKFNPDGSIATDSRFILTDLSLAEGPNGPISKALNLPAPLDAAIGAMQGADGSITFPLSFATKPPRADQAIAIDYPAIGIAAAGGVGSVLATAIASAPLKAAGDVGALFGISGGDKAKQSRTVTVPFKAGSIAFGSASQQTIESLLKQMADDPSLTATIKHQLGAGDVSRAAERANPSKDQCDALQQQLRARKVELLNLRANTAGRARAQLMSLGVAGAKPAMAQLAAIDRELAGVEDSLDQVCDLLRPGAEKLTERRTRTAALRIASLRLSEVKAELLASGLPQIADRVKIIPPRFDPSSEENGTVEITVVQKK